jgi:Spy/CpxP family protein refolding chaperone
MSFSVRLASGLFLWCGPSRASLGLAVAVTLAACSGSTTSTEGTNAPSVATAQGSTQTGAVRTAPVAPQVMGHARAVADALSQVPLRDDQRAEVEKMAADSEQRHLAVSAAHTQVATALAGQIESGTIDRAALQPAIDAAEAAASAARPLDHAAMEHLHALLTPEQRGQFVDAMEAAHGKHTMGSHKARMEEWANDLKLTDDQRAQIAAILKSQHSAHHEDFKAMHGAHGPGGGFMESFRGETLAPPPAPADAELHAHANEHADHLVAVITQVLPLLTPEQRSLAAAKIRAHADSLDAVGGPSPE